MHKLFRSHRLRRSLQMQRLSLLTLIAGLLALEPSVTHADMITGLFPTGVDSSGNALPQESMDAHYTVLENGNASAFVVKSTDYTGIPSSWVDNNSTSMWIWQQSNGQPVNVTRTFRLTFDLTGLDANTASVSGTWATDNVGEDILINGISTGQTTPNSDFQFHPFLVSSGFLSGLNTLDFVVHDGGNIAGFRVGSLSGEATPVPEPSGLLLGSVGLLGLVCLNGRIRKRVSSHFQRPRS